MEARQRVSGHDMFIMQAVARTLYAAADVFHAEVDMDPDNPASVAQAATSASGPDMLISLAAREIAHGIDMVAHINSMACDTLYWLLCDHPDLYELVSSGNGDVFRLFVNHHVAKAEKLIDETFHGVTNVTGLVAKISQLCSGKDEAKKGVEVLVGLVQRVTVAFPVINFIDLSHVKHIVTVLLKKVQAVDASFYTNDVLPNIMYIYTLYQSREESIAREIDPRPVQERKDDRLVWTANPKITEITAGSGAVARSKVPVVKSGPMLMAMMDFLGSSMFNNAMTQACGWVPTPSTGKGSAEANQLDFARVILNMVEQLQQQQQQQGE